MSGGHFNYKQYEIGTIADEVESIILNNSTDEYPYSEETIKEFIKGLVALKVAQVYAQRIDWLVSCDDGEDSFHKRLQDELKKLEIPTGENDA